MSADWNPEGVDPSCYIFSAEWSEIPANSLLMPTVGNGHLATVVFRDRIFMNGLYNGEGNKSHRAAIPALNLIKLKLQADSISEMYSLHCIQGVFTHQSMTADAEVKQLMYAHRSIPSILVNQISIVRCKNGDNTADISIDVQAGTDFVSPDLVLKELETRHSCTKLYRGSILQREVPGDTDKQISQLYISVDIPASQLVLPGGCNEVNFTYIMSINSSQQQCAYQYSKAKKLSTEGSLLRAHTAAWARLWQEGRIDMWSADMNTNQVVYGCQYYLYSSLPSQYESDCVVDEFYGLSPESLAYGDMSEDDYLGHVFWDQETWMYPPILLMHPDIAEQMLKPRYRVMSQANTNAERSGNRGMRFPWEQGVTGIPTSPSDDCEHYEVHINADIALALRQYVYLTGEVTDDSMKLSKGLAEYWVSRLSYLEDKKMYGILDVMPPDEWHYPVNNSAYTNLAAHLAITLPDFLDPSVKYSQQLLTTRWPDGTHEIYVPFDAQKNYHPEFDGYSLDDPTKTSRVKQADVVLIGYPLNLETNQETRKNDLELYEKVTTTNGPAMTWSMFCVGHLELGQTDKADELFKRQLLQANKPFQVWSEYPGGGGAINFITGMGGFLQSVLNGYMGIRLHSDRVSLCTKYLPPSTTRLKLTGLSFWQSKTTIDITQETVSIKVTLLSPGSKGISLTVTKRDGTKSTTKLSINNPAVLDQVDIQHLEIHQSGE